ncbi:MarR family winged helix-turn-helix transcriptional regulator [Ornithinicoccus halotolerans]|uniref:MarR family winged helix-turn-helix transcriptional regulator n=1 Tax=Ornithinicoccus halotolerans TaxID=1748220 RepID=UPI001294F995|nr:MarR family transcriptional regulator [Ornithinicoccus halotolerans]
MSEDRGQAVYALLRHVRPVVLGSARVVETGVRAVGWTVGSRAVVEVLYEDGPATVPQVATRLDLPRQGVQRHVDDLLELGHVATQPNPRHRRSHLVTVTEAGRETFGRLRERELRQLRQLAPDCTDGDIATATAVLAALHRDIRARGSARLPREER